MKKALILHLVLVSLFANGQIAKSAVEQEVVWNQDTISGTLLFKGSLKQVLNPETPLVIFIAGSGPTDRDGNSALGSGKGNPMKMLAEQLLDQGVYSYRFDKVGVGKSTFNVLPTEYRFSDNASVVNAIIDKLQKIGFKNIYLLGHSEGSLVGIMSAQQKTVKGLISVAGPAQNATDMIKEQLGKQMAGPMLKQANQKLDSLKQGYKIEHFNMMLGSIFNKAMQPYLISWAKYTPADEIQKLKIPVLIVQGQKDIQVSEKEAQKLHENSPKSALKVYENANHVLKNIVEGVNNIQSYSDNTVGLVPEIAPDIANWINTVN